MENIRKALESLVYHPHAPMTSSRNQENPSQPLKASAASAAPFSYNGRLHFCDFCQKETMHTSIITEPVEAFNGLIDENLLLKCQVCEAFTLS